jgi:hypothetical protein
MATGDDTLLRMRPKSTLLTDIKPSVARGAESEQDAEAEPADGDRFVALPQPGDPYDTAYSRPRNTPVPTLRFVMGDTIRGLPYANLDSIGLVPNDKPGAAPAIVIVFSGVIPRKAVITGRHLLVLLDMLSDHRIAWVRELPKGRDFKDGKTTVITGIAIERVTEMPD